MKSNQLSQETKEFEENLARDEAEQIRFLVIDIETRASKDLIQTYVENIKAPKNIKDPEKIKARIEEKTKQAERDLAVDQDYSEIACIGIKEDDQPARIVTLSQLSDIIKEHNPIVVTFNGKSFDIPIIIKSGLKQGLELPYRDLKAMTKKWNAPMHYDLIEVVSFNGQYKSLDSYLQIYLGIKKKEIDFDTCTDEELKEHCIEDCENTYKLFTMFKNIC